MKKILLAFALSALSAFHSATAQVTDYKRSSAAAASLVVKASKGTLLSVSGYNAKGSAQFIQILDAASLPGDATAEVSTSDLTGLTAAGLANKYFLISSPTVDYYVWFNLDAGGVDPAVSGRTAIAVAISTGDSASTMATAAAAAIDALAAFVSSATGAVITITNASTGTATDIGAGNSGAAVAVTTQGITATVPIFVLTAAASSNFSFTIPAGGVTLSTGIVVCNSSTYATKTIGSADCFFTAVIGTY